MTLLLDGASESGVATLSTDPFAESTEATSQEPSSAPPRSSFTPWTESLSPFGEGLDSGEVQNEQDRLISAALAELRDEAFDEAVAYLAEETEQAVAGRFSDEASTSGEDRERFAEMHLSGLRFETQQYLDRLEVGLAGADVESLSEAQLDELLDQFDPPQGELTPAGEEFIGGLIRKAKKAIKFVVNTAKGAVKGAIGVVGKVAGTLLGPILGRLKALINPLLRRVLAFAIGRLPAPLRPAAQILARRITGEAYDEMGEHEGYETSETSEGSESSEDREEEESEEGAVSPANLSDPETIAQQFDEALAEAMFAESATQPEYEGLDGTQAEAADGRELETLAEARRVLLDQIRSAKDDEDLGPAVEQFVPALLGALRIGIRLVGRPKVVRFLAGYLGQLIRRWVGPNLSGPLSNAIVDTGLRLISLEAESPEAYPGESAHLAIGGVIEDAVRRLAENEEYVFENEELMQLATAEAFSRAVATNFPPSLLKARLQQAPSLAGTFVTRRPRSLRPFRRYTRTPEVEITAQVADALPTFGGVSVGAVLRAAGAPLPMRARLHIFEATIGTTLPRIARVYRASGLGGHLRADRMHPLTPEAAALLLREPGLGVRVPSMYLRSRHRIAAGQRFYVIEPIGSAAALGALAGPITRAGVARISATRSWTTINLRKSRIVVGIYLSEADAQEIAAGIRQGRGPAAFLQALIAAYRTRRNRLGSPRIRVLREDRTEAEELAMGTLRSLTPGFARSLRRRIRGWAMTALARWAPTGGEAFARAAADPADGVTVRVEMTAVPGLDLIRRALSGGLRTRPVMGALGAPVLGAPTMGLPIRGTPSIAVTVTPGRPRR